MKEFVEKLIDRLKEELSNSNEKTCRENILLAMQKNLTIYTATEIVKELAEEIVMGKVSDGYHTFDELYHHRAVLFSVICNSNKEKAWKSKLHDAGDMFEGMFIVGIKTPEGQATYHYDINPYWDMFKVKELPKAPKWDGHSPDEAIRRIGLLAEEYQPRIIIDGQYCWQTCACTEKCKECNRLTLKSNDIDWYENIEDWTEEYNAKNRSKGK